MCCWLRGACDRPDKLNIKGNALQGVIIWSLIMFICKDLLKGNFFIVFIGYVYSILLYDFPLVWRYFDEISQNVCTLFSVWNTLFINPGANTLVLLLWLDGWLTIWSYGVLISVLRALFSSSLLFIGVHCSQLCMGTLLGII